MDDGANNKRTVIEEGTSFKGTLTSSCPIDVRGRIEGDIETPSLSVSASGAVHGKAKVKAVRSEGELSGEFDADSVELAGTVRDNTIIRAKSLEVKLAAHRGKMQVIFGECELSVGDEPTEHVELDVPATVAEVAAAPEPAPEPLPVTTIVEEPAPAPMAAAPEPAFGGVIEALAAASAVEAQVAGGAENAPAGEGSLDAELAELGIEPEALLDTSAKGAGDPVRSGRKRRRGRSDEDGTDHTGWSQPPSQPPPA
jgi:cytoskeletal protein CcmA (bactofilin family)